MVVQVSGPGRGGAGEPSLDGALISQLKMLLQAVEYRAIGEHHADSWIESARKGLSAETARRIAQVTVKTSPAIAPSLDLPGPPFVLVACGL